MAKADSVVELNDIPLKKDTKVEDSPIRPNQILGLPFHYTSLSDPGGRVFSKTFLLDMPVITLTPGRPLFLSKQKITDQEEYSLLKAMSNVKDGDEASISTFLKSIVSNKADVRYYGFKSDYQEFFKYVQLMVSTVYAKMGLLRGNGLYSFGDSFTAEFGTNGIPFYYERSTNISESADNEFTSSKLEGAMKSVSSIRRELDYILGTDQSRFVDLERMQKESNNKMVENSLAQMKSEKFFEELLDGNVGRVGSMIDTVFHGSQLLFPEVWNDSKFTKSYNLNFKFYSPYGDPLSIFNNVLVPFLTLLCFAMPKQDTLMGYYAPFLIRAESPGYFVCDMG
jgi:hypothetical protein